MWLYGVDVDKVALLFEVGNNGLSRLVAVHAVILAAVYDLRVLVDALDLLKVMAQADLIVVRVMAGRHLNGAGAEAELDIVVRDDGQLAPDKREDSVLADKVLILFIRGLTAMPVSPSMVSGSGGAMMNPRRSSSIG